MQRLWSLYVDAGGTSGVPLYRVIIAEKRCVDSRSWHLRKEGNTTKKKQSHT